jgi:hypothetical protein
VCVCLCVGGMENRGSGEGGSTTPEPYRGLLGLWSCQGVRETLCTKAVILGLYVCGTGELMTGSMPS